MPDRSAHFIFAFFILFLSILFLMFVMFAVITHFDPDVQVGRASPTASGETRQPSEAKKGGLPDLTPLYRANLFAIDLCLIVLAETVLIILFVKFTVPATLIATLATIFMTLKVSNRFRSDPLPEFLSRLVTNRYATLSHTDMMLLIILSGLIMSFLVSVLLKQAGVGVHREEPQHGAVPPSSPPPSW